MSALCLGPGRIMSGSDPPGLSQGPPTGSDPPSTPSQGPSKGMPSLPMGSPPNPLAERDPPSPLEAEPRLKQTRSDSSASDLSRERKFGLVPIPKFRGNQLPTNGEALRRVFYIKDSSGQATSIKSICETVFDEIQAIYEKIPCPVQKKSHAVEKLAKLHQAHRNMAKYDVKSAAKGLPDSKQAKFLESLNELFDISAKTAVDQIKMDRLRSEERIKEDLSFLKDQQTQRLGTFGRIDRTYNYRQEAWAKRSADEAQSLSTAREKLSSTSTSAADFVQSSDSEPEPGPSTKDSDYEPAKTRYKCTQYDL